LGLPSFVLSSSRAQQETDQQRRIVVLQHRLHLRGHQRPLHAAQRSALAWLADQQSGIPQHL
jgi:hypothetical protein